MADYWTIQTLNNADGINRYHETTLFNFPPGQMGNVAGEYFDDANAPTWGNNASIAARYSLTRTGLCLFGFDTGGAGNCTNGNDTGKLVVSGPYTSITDVSIRRQQGVLQAYYQGGGPFTGNAVMIVDGSSKMEIHKYDTELLHNGFSSGNDDIMFDIVYKAF